MCRPSVEQAVERRGESVLTAAARVEATAEGTQSVDALVASEGAGRLCFRGVEATLAFALLLLLLLLLLLFLFLFLLLLLLTFLLLRLLRLCLGR